MMGWCILCREPRLQGVHWSDDVHGIRVDNGYVAETKDKWEELNRSEIVATDDALPQCLWSRYFIERQGYTLEEIDFLQDNISDMLMEKNGKESSKKCKNHI